MRSMSPQPRLSVLARALTAVTAALVVPLTLPMQAGANFVPWGTVLVPAAQWTSPDVSALGDVNVYSNGDGNQDQVNSYGLAYECVELAQRFAAIRYGEQKIWPVSYAYQMWAVAPSLKVPFTQLPNGGSTPPQTGDLMIFDHTGGAPYGHVAVVADTGPGYVDIVEQNWGNSNPVGSARLPITNTTMPARYGIPIIGWLRSSVSAIPLKPTLITETGQVYPVGGATNFGGPVSLAMASPLVGAAGLPSGKGYWMVGGDGGIFTYGGARFYGSTGGMKLNAPVIGMASTASGNGYWLVAADGGIFSFGDARFYGSTGGIKLNKPVNGMAATSNGSGYWLVASDGGIFSFGDAPFYGSAGGIQVPSPVVRMVRTGDGMGYWLATSGGSLYAYGNAKYLANSGVVGTPSPVVGMVTTVATQ
jgi:hypothetical protein